MAALLREALLLLEDVACAHRQARGDVDPAHCERPLAQGHAYQPLEGGVDKLYIPDRRVVRERVRPPPGFIAAQRGGTRLDVKVRSEFGPQPRVAPRRVAAEWQVRLPVAAAAAVVAAELHGPVLWLAVDDSALYDRRARGLVHI